MQEKSKAYFWVSIMPILVLWHNFPIISVLMNSNASDQILNHATHHAEFNVID